MSKQCTAIAKRALAFTLVLVLLLSLAPTLPLVANATAYTDGAWYRIGNDWINISFETAATNTNGVFVFNDDAAYDWVVKIKPTKSPPVSSVASSATITDASGEVIGTKTKTVSVAQGDVTEMSIPTDFANLTTGLYGTFTLVCEAKIGSTVYASYTTKFSRVNTNPITATVTSRSNPDNVFTFADPIDLVLNIKKSDGIATAYNAAVTVTNSSGTELLAARGVSLPASTNTVLSVKDLVDLPDITTAGTYKVNLTLTDSTGAVKHQASFPFYVVALTGNLTATITSQTSTNLTFNNMVPDLVVNLSKADGISETLSTAVTVKNSSGTTVYSDTFETTGVAATVTPDFSGLATTGTFTMTAVVTDDADNQRASTSVTFTRTNTVPMTYTLSNYNDDNTGNIYASGDDFSLSLKITHKPSAGQVMSVKAVGTLNGKPFESPVKKATLSSISGTTTVTVNGAMLNSYGIFEDISLVVCNSSGVQLCQTTETYSFSRVLSTADPGDLPLLNINDHFTSGKGDGAKKLALAAKTGANMWRACIPWATIEKSKGSYDISVVQSVMDATKSNGMQALVILAYNNELYGSANPTDTTWLNAYANYCYYVADMMAQYYPNQIVGFEIWNEWNHATMGKVPADYRTGAHYATVVKAASEKINQVNQKRGTNFKVIAGATAGDAYLEPGETTSNSYEFVHEMLDVTGFKEAVDGISFHTYSSRETTNSRNNPRRFEYISPAEHNFVARISNFQDLLDQYGAGDKEIWLTETGWTTNEVPEETTQTSDGKKHITTGATEQEAAAYMVQLYTWALADGTLDRIFWYDLMNDISNQTQVWANNQTESNYGLIHNWDNSGDQPLAYSAKQGYVAMCALSSKLAGATYQGTVSLGSGVEAYKFTGKDGQTMVVAWTTSKTTKTLNCSGSMTVTDMYGNATSGLTTATLSECPIYIVCNSGTLSVG